MKRTTFGIYVKENSKTRVKEVPGYIIDYGIFRFGLYKSCRRWAITEISTGMLIGVEVERLKDVFLILDKNIELLEKLIEILKNPDERILEAQEKIREFYTIK